MPLIVVTIALDTDQPERTVITNTPLSEPAHALILARTLGGLQQQLLDVATAQPPAPPEDLPPAPEQPQPRIPRGKRA